jgi:hypothetical protein
MKRDIALLPEAPELEVVRVGDWEVAMESEGPRRARVQVTLVEAMNVPKYDLVGLNPLESFCRVALRDTQQVFTTRVIPDDVNPKWNETFQFTFDEPEQVLQITLCDRDEFDDIEIAGIEIALAKKEGVVEQVDVMTPVGYGDRAAGAKEKGLPAPSLYIKVATTLEVLD